MTDNEIKAYIESLVEERLPQAKQTPRLFQQVHHKWFRDEKGNAANSKMGKAWGGDGVKTYRVWDNLRPILNTICGTSYVRNIDPDDKDFITGVADKLCQMIYDARMEYVERRKDDDA